MCLISFFPRPFLTLGYFILAPYPSHMLQLFLGGQRQSLWNNLYCGGKAGPGQLAWLCYLLPARAQGTDVMAQCLPPLLQGVSICIQGRDKLCSGLLELLLGAMGTPSPLTHLLPLALTHLPLCLAPLHLTAVTAQTWAWFNQRCWGGGFPGGPSGKVPHANTGDAAEPFHFLSASLQTFLSSELPPSRPSQPSQGPGGEGVCLASLPENI